MKGVAAWRTTLIVGLLTLAASVVLVLLGIWTGDGRWAGTAAVAVVVGLLLTCCASVGLDL